MELMAKCRGAAHVRNGQRQMEMALTVTVTVTGTVGVAVCCKL